MTRELEVLIQDRPDVDLPQISEREQKIISTIDNIWLQWRRWYESNHKTRHRNCYKRYNATVEAYDDVDDEWRGINGAPVRMAIEYSVVETYKTRLLKGIIGNQEIFKILPNKQSTIKNAELMQKLVTSFLNKDDGIKKFITFLDQGCIYGSAPWLVYQKQQTEQYIKQETKTVPRSILGLQVGEEEITQEVVAERYTENRPCLEIYDVETVAFNHALGAYEDSPYFVFRQLIHRSVLRDLYPDMANYFDSGLLDWDGKDDFAAEKQVEIGKSNDTALANEGRIEVKYYMEPDGMVIVFSNKMIKEIKAKTSARKKEVYTGMLNVLPKSFEPYGLDLITLNSQFADIWNELINIDLDATKLAANPWIKIKKNAGVELDTIFFGPGNQWIMDDFEAVEAGQFQYSGGSVLSLLEYISGKDQQITGATNITMGVPSNAKFSSDIQRMTVESNLKFWLVLLNVREELKKIIRAYVHHIQEYIAPTISPDNPLVFMTTGNREGFDQVEINNPADLEGDFDYKISLEIEDIDQGLLRAQIGNAIEIVSKNPVLAQFANPPELIKLIFKMFPNIKDLENLVGSPQEQLTKMLATLDPQQLTGVLGMIQQMIVEKSALPPAPSGGPGGLGGPEGLTRIPTTPQGVEMAARRQPVGPGMAGAETEGRMF